MIVQDENDVRQRIRSFVLASVNLADLKDEDDLFESGLVTSLFAVQLMTFLEKTFDIEVAMDDLDFDNFKSVRDSAAFVVRKKGGNAV